MDAYLRPDLSHILPRPWVREIAERALAFAPIRPVAEVLRSESFLVDVDRRNASTGEEPGFDAHNAQAVARRVQRALGNGTDARSLHRFTAERVQQLRLDD